MTYTRLYNNIYISSHNPISFAMSSSSSSSIQYDMYGTVGMTVKVVCVCVVVVVMVVVDVVVVVVHVDE